MSLVAIKGQTRWSLLPLSGIKPYKQRSALVRAYVDLSISIVWRNARLCATINYRWQIQIRWIRIGWTAYFVDYRYRQLPSLSSRQSIAPTDRNRDDESSSADLSDDRGKFELYAGTWEAVRDYYRVWILRKIYERRWRGPAGLTNRGRPWLDSHDDILRFGSSWYFLEQV